MHVWGSKSKEDLIGPECWQSAHGRTLAWARSLTATPISSPTLPHSPRSNLCVRCLVRPSRGRAQVGPGGSYYSSSSHLTGRGTSLHSGCPAGPCMPASAKPRAPVRLRVGMYKHTPVHLPLVACPPPIRPMSCRSLASDPSRTDAQHCSILDISKLAIMNHHVFRNAICLPSACRRHLD